MSHRAQGVREQVTVEWSSCLRKVVEGRAGTYRDDLSVTAFLLRNHFSQRGMHSQGQETKWLISGSGGGIGEEKTINWRLTSKGSDLSGNGGP